MLLEMLEDQQYPDLENVSMKTLPKIGYIALMNNQPIAAGFLRKVEGNIVAQLDGLTSNPYFGSQIRHEGISKVVDRLIEDAKDMKLKGIIAFTNDNGVLARAQSIGFNTINSTLIALKFR
jgi:hypothetical protein